MSHFRGGGLGKVRHVSLLARFFSRDGPLADYANAVWDLLADWAGTSYQNESCSECQQDVRQSICQSDSQNGRAAKESALV